MHSKKKHTSSTLSLYHGATVMMEVVALHIPLNQSLARCALGRNAVVSSSTKHLRKLKAYFGSSVGCVF